MIHFFHYKLCLEVVGNADHNFTTIETFSMHLHFKADQIHT